MTKNKNLLVAALMLCAAFFTTSCSEDNPVPQDKTEEQTGKTKYIIASTPTASQGVADYLLTTDDLTKGTVSTVGNGIEQDGTYRYYVTGKNKFFSLLYGQGNPGAVTTYQLSEEGKLTKLSNFQSETVQAFAAVKDDILMMKIPRSGDENASWYRMNADQMQIVGEGKINIAKLAGNGERAHFSWLTQVGDKVFAPYMSIKGCCNDVFGTQYPDSSWVAVFSYPDMKLEKVIRDNRASFIGRYFTNGLVEDEKGDAYAFSASVATNSGVYTSTKPSGFLKINKGETSFNQNYFFNVQEASGGYHITAQNYVGNGKFIVMMSDVKNSYAVGKKLGIADVYNQTFTWVQGAPEPANITNITTNNFTAGDGTAYVGMTTEEGSYVYKVDAGKATATRGLKVEGGRITAISKLTY